jgi:hypothetical protein
MKKTRYAIMVIVINSIWFSLLKFLFVYALAQQASGQQKISINTKI